MFIYHDYIEKILEDSKNVSKDEIQSVIDKARRREGLNHKEVGILLQVEDKDQLEEIINLLEKLKNQYMVKELLCLHRYM